MSEPSKEDTQSEQQWRLLEAYYHQNKPIVARLIGITNGEMLVDVGGIQGYIERFIHAFTKHSPIESSLEETQSPEEIQSSVVQLARQSLANLGGEEVLLRIVEMDKERKHLKLSQKLYQKEKAVLDIFEIGSTHIGIIVSMNVVFVRVDLAGVMGRLPAKQPIPNQSKLLDLTTVLHIGQEVKVNIVRNQGNSLVLSLEDLKPYIA